MEGLRKRSSLASCTATASSLYISDKEEQEMMTLPSEDEERLGVNYME